MAPMFPGLSAQTPCIIVGGSVAGLTLAARLARQRRGRTVLFAPPIVESRRLVSGCTLRQSGLHLLATSFGCSPGALVDRITGGRGLFSRMRMCVGRARPDGSLRFDDAFDIHDTGSVTRPLGLSTRHGQILVGLRRSLAGLDVEIVERPVTDRAQLAAYAPSPGALLVNATPAPVLGGRLPPATGRFVVAAQAPCVEARGGLRAPLLPGVGHASLLGYADGAHVSFFTPFYDPLSPRASWYGFIGRIVDSADDPSARLAATTDKLDRLAAALGLELHDPAQTLGAAQLPIRRASPLFGDGVLDAYHGLESGAPGVAADGMLAMALGAMALGEALLRGDPLPERDVARALSRLRRDNRLTQQMLTRLPVGLVAALARFAPALIARQFAPGWLAL